MTREEKCKLAIERGYTYDPETGFIYGLKGKKIIRENGLGYIKICFYINKKEYSLFAHQFAWYFINKKCAEEIDHINGVRNDNRICNLRAVTKQQNHFNRTTAKGYYWKKKLQKWESSICINKKNVYLGVFNTEQEARNAYLAAKEIYHKI